MKPMRPNVRSVWALLCRGVLSCLGALSVCGVSGRHTVVWCHAQRLLAANLSKHDAARERRLAQVHP